MKTMKDAVQAFGLALFFTTGLCLTLQYGTEYCPESFWGFFGMVAVMFFWTFGIISSLSPIDHVETEL